MNTEAGCPECGSVDVAWIVYGMPTSVPSMKCTSRFGNAAWMAACSSLGGVRVVNGEAQVAWLGPPMVADVGIQVVGSEVCGGLCGHGSVWLVEEKYGEWEVTGMAPGYGSWIA